MAEDHQTGPNARLLAPAGPDAGRERQARFGRALGLSLAAHAVAALVALLALGRTAAPADVAAAPAARPEGIVWIAQEGRGRGGGGGGDQHQEPPQVAHAPGLDRLTVPVASAPRPADEISEPSHPNKIDIPAVATAAGLEDLTGILGSVPFTSVSLGRGNGPGAGDGRQGGIGGGDGDGLGDGQERGTGGGVFEPGDGVSMPRLIYETKPKYTDGAMRAKVQGAVLMEGVVTPEGMFSTIRITRSLDSHFGLDEEAVRTVREWRFAPGRTRDGKPVAVRVAIEMAFTLR